MTSDAERRFPNRRSPGSIRPTTTPASVRVGSTANSAGATAMLKKAAAPSQRAEDRRARRSRDSHAASRRLPLHDASRAAEKAVRRPLMTDRRRGAVAGMHARSHHRARRSWPATRSICAGLDSGRSVRPIDPAKSRSPPNTVRPFWNTTWPGRMTRRVHDIEDERADAHAIALGELEVGIVRLLERQRRTSPPGSRRAAYSGRSAGCMWTGTCHSRWTPGDAADVIDVRVRQPDRLERRARTRAPSRSVRRARRRDR